MQIQVKKALPVNLNDETRHAVEIEENNKAEKKHLEGQNLPENHISLLVDKSDVKSCNSS